MPIKLSSSPFWTAQSTCLEEDSDSFIKLSKCVYTKNDNFEESSDSKSIWIDINVPGYINEIE